MLEKKYSTSQVKNALNNLEKIGILQSFKYDIRDDACNTRFYFPAKLSMEFVEKNMVKKMIKWHIGFPDTDVKTVKMVGEHLYYLVKNELRANGFEILKERHVRSYRGKEWFRTKHTLDIIAKHKIKKISTCLGHA